MLIEIIGAALGVVGIAASIIKFACDELTEEERCRQDTIRAKQAEQRIQFENQLREIDELREAQLEELRKKYGEELSDERCRLELQIEDEHKKARSELAGSKLSYRHRLRDEYKMHAEERLKYAESLIEETKKAVRVIGEQRKQVQTVARKNAMNYFLHELKQTKDKAYAYKNYIKGYVGALDKYELSDTRELELFSFLLPREVLYAGKTVTLTTQELQKGLLTVPFSYPSKFRLDEDIWDLPDSDNHTVLCYGGGQQHENIYTLSRSRGIFKTQILTNPHIGVTATVTGNEKVMYSLSAYGMTLQMHMSNLEDTNRRPPVGAELRVFPIEWRTDLSRIYVSEKASDVLHSFSFDRLPIVFSAQGVKEFKEYMERENLIDSTEEWKIAPFQEESLSDLSQVRLQLGTSLVLLARICQEDGNCWFSYEGILSIQEYAVKPEEIFAAVDCVMVCVEESERSLLTQREYQNMQSIAMFVFTEFRNQHALMQSQAGVLYYNKWAELLDKLITFKYKGESFTADIEDTCEDERGWGVWVTFPDKEAVNLFCDKVYMNAFRKRDVSFFIELERGKYCFVSRFDPDRRRALLNTSEPDKLMNMKQITIYSKNNVLVESRQKRAIDAFRMGKLVNPRLQVDAMDAASIRPRLTNTSVSSFFDPRLPRDQTQMEAVQRVMNEEDIFLIQGPPGTGKTTVIIELIKQILESGSSRILVVSQANVAVDNVLKRMLLENPGQLIRCGTASKIAPDIYPISYEKCYNDYLQHLEEKRHSNAVDQALLTRWMKIVQPERRMNPEIGELILRTRSIIGATCIGLANKSIGLERMTFDLVIIDEAGKALPGEILVPFIRAKKVVLIGDHKQLPPIIDPALRDNEKIELEARDQFEEPLFDESFFSRMWSSAPMNNKHSLLTQYRMPATIGTMISTIFYDGKIRNGEGAADKASLIRTINNSIAFLELTQNPRYKEAISNGVTNEEEGRVLQRLLAWLSTQTDCFMDRMVAVITPYRAQKRLLKRAVATLSGSFSNVIVDTVDAFQGDEADIVIYCSTRAQRTTRYFADFRRVNVALSRARHNLIFVGSLRYFDSFKKAKFESPLPKVADYVREHGQILQPTFLDEVEISLRSESETIYLSPFQIKVADLHDILPPDFEKRLDALSTEYEKTGSLPPLSVLRQGGEYLLSRGYTELYLAKRLGLDEVECCIE